AASECLRRRKDRDGGRGPPGCLSGLQDCRIWCAGRSSPHVSRIGAPSDKPGIALRRAWAHIEGASGLGVWPMIYLLAVFIPPLALLLTGQPFSAIFNVILIVACFLLGLIFPAFFLVPSLHAVIAVHMKREDRKHRELVNAIERHGPPPGWCP